MFELQNQFLRICTEPTTLPPVDQRSVMIQFARRMLFIGTGRGNNLKMDFSRHRCEFRLSRINLLFIDFNTPTLIRTKKLCVPSLILYEKSSFTCWTRSTRTDVTRYISDSFEDGALCLCGEFRSDCQHSQAWLKARLHRILTITSPIYMTISIACGKCPMSTSDVLPWSQIWLKPIQNNLLPCKQVRDRPRLRQRWSV